MKSRITLRPRKTPRQARSALMNDTLLEAAARVLASHGAAGFNTNRVAQVAGVSVGSLYQYYPNKAALLLSLHQRDAEHAWLELEAILDDESRTPRQRLERLILRFFEMQAGAPEQHVALLASQANVSATPEYQELETRIVARLRKFLTAALPDARGQHAFLARFCVTVATATGERVVAARPSNAEVGRVARATARMLGDFVGL